MSYEHIKTLEQFQLLTTEEKADCLQERRRIVADIIAAEARGQLLEQELVPRIPVRKVVVEPTPNPEEDARNFFRRHSDATRIEIGGVVYTRGK